MTPSVWDRLLQTQSDQRLVALARDGDGRAFEALVLRYHKPLLGYARRLLMRGTSAEDVLQQAFLQAWLALQLGAEVSAVKPWLYRIVHNTGLSVQRKSSVDYAPLSESLAAVDSTAAHVERRIAVRDALAGVAALPALQREALLQTAVGGRSHEQVAAALGLSNAAVRGLVYRARATLRRAATAITPFPTVVWADHAGGTPLGGHFSEAGTTGGDAEIAAAVLAKGGAIAITASGLVVGVSAVLSKLWARHAGGQLEARSPGAVRRERARAQRHQRIRERRRIESCHRTEHGSTVRPATAPQSSGDHSGRRLVFSGR